jgi:hypothetical protein
MASSHLFVCWVGLAGKGHLATFQLNWCRKILGVPVWLEQPSKTTDVP